MYPYAKLWEACESTCNMVSQPVPWVCRLFYKFGRQHNAALRQWYSFGVAVAAMLGMSVIFMLLQDVWLAAVWIREVCPCAVAPYDLS